MKIYCCWNSCHVSFIWSPLFGSLRFWKWSVFSHARRWISAYLIYCGPVVCFFSVFRFPQIYFIESCSGFYRTLEDRTKLALNLPSWKPIYLKLIALFLSSFWWTTFIFLSLRCIILSGGEKIIRFLVFELVLRVFFAFIFCCFLKCSPL